MRYVVAAFLFTALLTGLSRSEVNAQTEFDQKNIENELLPDPTGAFWRSLVLPGWGHRYVDKNSWTRGQWHLGSEVLLILSWVGLRVRANNLQDDAFTFVRSFANTDIEGRERDFVLAVKDFNNLQQYNDFKERSRQWDDIFPNTPEFQWQWESTQKRQEFQDLRDREDTIESQIPAVIGLMLVNRVVSAISASNKAKEKIRSLPEFTLSKPNYAPNAYQATIRIGF